MKKILCILLIFPMLCFTLTGCNDKLREENEIISIVEDELPNCEFVNVKSSIDDNGKEQKEYKFKNDDFEFCLIDYLSEDSFGFDTNAVSTTYLQETLKQNKEKLLKLLDDYNIKIYDKTQESFDNEKLENFKKNEGILLIFDISEYNAYETNFSFLIGKYKDIETIYDFIKDFYNIIEKYIPDKPFSLENFPIDIQISTKKVLNPDKYNKNSVYLLHTNFSVEGLEFDYAEKWSKYEYASAVKDGYIFDSAIDVNKVKPFKLDKLYIDGELYESERYETNFYYNIDDEKYYTIVSFGMQFEYNGGVDDYLQREIIQKYHPKSNYTITDSKDTSEYRIGLNKYKVKWSDHGLDSVSGDRDELLFYKNGKKLDIKNIYYLGNHSAGASYNKYISVDDFAKIMEMKVEKINIEERAVYLSTK